MVTQEQKRREISTLLRAQVPYTKIMAQVEVSLSTIKRVRRSLEAGKTLKKVRKTPGGDFKRSLNFLKRLKAEYKAAPLLLPVRPQGEHHRVHARPQNCGEALVEVSLPTGELCLHPGWGPSPYQQPHSEVLGEVLCRLLGEDDVAGLVSRPEPA